MTEPDTMTTTTDRTPWQLARLADCADPDTPESPGAHFLAGVETAVAESIEYGETDDDAAHEIADSAVPTYTRDLWLTFVDLAAYQEDPTELGADGSNMEESARVCLYLIAARLARALFEEHAESDNDEETDE